MTAAPFAPCRCAHPRIHHQQHGFDAQCTALNCMCVQFRPGDGSGAALSAASWASRSTCPECGRPFPGAQQVGAHRWQAHDTRGTTA